MRGGLRVVGGNALEGYGEGRHFPAAVTGQKRPVNQTQYRALNHPQYSC